MRCLILLVIGCLALSAPAVDPLIDPMDGDLLAYLGMQPVESSLAIPPAAPASTNTIAVTNNSVEWFGGNTPWWQWSRLTGDWGTIRPKLETSGLTFGGRDLVDTSGVLSGGARRGVVVRNLLDLNVTFDPQPLLNIQGGTFFAQYFNRQGPYGSDDIGDLQGYDDMDAGPLNQLEELWYEQKLFSGGLRIKAGQVDANDEFDSISAAGEFINSSAGFSPTLLGFPTYPNPALSVNVFGYPADWFYSGAGIYTGSLEALSANQFRHPYYIGEAGLKLNQWPGPSQVAAGVWRESAAVPRCGGTEANGASGFYTFAEQHVWKPGTTDVNDDQGLSVFAQYGLADPTVCAFQHQIGLGINGEGLLPGREEDAVGFYWTWAKTSRMDAAYARNEIDYEVFYKLQVTPFFSLKPDLQWIQNPGGQTSPDHACVITLRATIIF